TRPTGWSGPLPSHREPAAGAPSAPLEEDPADELHLQLTGIRAQPGRDPLAAIAVDMRQLRAEAKPAHRVPAARCSKGVAVFARASAAGGVVQLGGKHIDAPGGAELAEIISREQVGRLEL